jgi:hypothetical protein
MGKKDEEKNEEYDMINTIMRNLLISESLQTRVLDYYEEKNLCQYMRNDELFSRIGTSLTDIIKMYYQLDESIKKLHFLDSKNIYELSSFARNVNIELFMPGDIILKEGDAPT